VSAGGDRLKVVVSGMIAAVPRQGGAAWAVLQYLLGLRRLGHDVLFVEQCEAESLQPKGAPLAGSENASYFADTMKAFGLEQDSALVLAGTKETCGASFPRLREVAREADILLNISGTLTDEELIGNIPVRAYIDLDPAFNQLWHAQGIDVGFGGHTHFVTVGQAIGKPDCPVPTCGLDWIPTLPPVVLEEWPRAETIVHDAFTTVGNWRGYGSVEHDGVQYGQRAHSLREFFALPRLTDATFQPALAIHPDEKPDVAALAENGWEVLDPSRVADTPARYREFIQGSRAELGVAKSGYVLSRCGWFSDRSACYLASGRPVIAQETGFSRFVPTGEGLFAFSSSDEVLAGIEELQSGYGRHAEAARFLAERHLDSDRVLGTLLERLGAAGSGDG
jgi:hypothetical protein